MYTNESFIELSFSEIELFKNGGFAMFYLYIDEVLISSYHKFSEVRDFIFDFYYDLVKRLDNPNQYSMEKFTDIMDDSMDLIVSGLCRHNYEYFIFLDHEVQVYYGF